MEMQGAYLCSMWSTITSMGFVTTSQYYYYFKKV